MPSRVTAGPPANDCEPVPRLLQLRREPQLLDELGGAVEQVQRPDHVARVDLDRARRLAVEHGVGSEAFLVAVEREADELALVVERRRARVAARDVEIALEVDRQVTTERRVGVRTELLRLDRLEQLLRRVERILAGVLREDLRRRRERPVRRILALRVQRLHGAVGDAQRRVRVRGERAAEHLLERVHVHRRDEHQLADARVFHLLVGAHDRVDALRGLHERVLARAQLRERALLEQGEARLHVGERRRLVPGVERLIDQRLVDLRALLDAEQRREPRAIRVGQLERTDERQAELAAIERRVELAGKLLLAGERARHVASLIAGLASGILLRARGGPARERQRGRQQRAAAVQRDRAVEVDARGAVLLCLDRFHLLDRGLVLLVTGLRDPVHQLLVLGILAGHQVGVLLEALHDALVLLEAVLRELLERRRLDRGLALVRRVRLREVVQLLQVGGEVRVVPLELVVKLARRLVAVRAARVAGDHHEVVGLEARGRDVQPVLGMERHVVGAGIGRLAVLADVRAEERPVAGVARPLPVVDLAAVVADRARRRVDEADVLDVEDLVQRVLGAAEERRHLATQLRAILLARVEQVLRALLRLFLARDRIFDLVEAVAHLLGDVAIRLQHHHVLRRTRRQLVGLRLREEAVDLVVVLRRRVELDRALHAVMVRDDQAVGRDQRRGAATEPHDRRERLLERIRELRGIELHAHLLERLGVLRQRHLRRLPHATRIRVAHAELGRRIRLLRRHLLRRAARLVRVVGDPELAARNRVLLVATAAGREQGNAQKCIPLHGGGIPQDLRRSGATPAYRASTARPATGATLFIKGKVRVEAAYLVLRYALSRFLAEVANLEQLVGHIEQEARRRARDDAAARDACDRARQVQLALRARDPDVAQAALLADVGRVIRVGDGGRLRLQRARVRQQLFLEADHEAHRELEALCTVQRGQDDLLAVVLFLVVLAVERLVAHVLAERIDALALLGEPLLRAEQALDVGDPSLRRRHARRRGAEVVVERDVLDERLHGRDDRMAAVERGLDAFDRLDELRDAVLRRAADVRRDERLPHRRVTGLCRRRELLDRRRADAARRIVDHAAQRELVLGVERDAQVRDEVLDLFALEELLAAVHHVRDLVRAQLLLEDLRLDVRAIEHRDVAEPAALLLQPADLLRDPLRFGFGRGGDRVRDDLAVAVLRPQRLAVAVLVVRDDLVRGLEDALRRAVVLLELDDLRAREHAIELEDVRRIGAAPAVDRLIVIADDHEVVRLRDERLHHAQLRLVGVLDLVDHHVVEALGPPRARVLVAIPQAHRLDDQVVEVERAERAQRLLILRKHVLRDLVVVVGRVAFELFGRDERVLRERDPRLDRLRVVATVAVVDRPHRLADDAELIRLGVDREPARHAECLALHAQDLEAERVERTDRQLAGELVVAEQRRDALSHLLGSLVRGRHRADRLRRR